jgi:hypothetical protein
VPTSASWPANAPCCPRAGCGNCRQVEIDEGARLDRETDIADGSADILVVALAWNCTSGPTRSRFRAQKADAEPVVGRAERDRLTRRGG